MAKKKTVWGKWQLRISLNFSFVEKPFPKSKNNPVFQEAVFSGCLWMLVGSRHEYL